YRWGMGRRSYFQVAALRAMLGRPSSTLRLFLDAGRLPFPLTEVVELGAADLAAAHHVHLADDRGVHREDPLHADAVGDLADGEGPAGASALHRDHHPLEDLDAVLLPLLDLDVHLHRVADTELRPHALDFTLF